jgi:hypothetical protein
LQQFKAGVEYRFGTDSERIQIAERNEDHTEADPWTDEVVKYLGKRSEIATVPKLLDHLGLSRDRQNNHSSQRVRQIAEKLGWRYGRHRIDGVRHQGLFPPGSADVHTVHAGGHTTSTPADSNQDKGSAPVSIPSIPKLDNKYIYINREVVHRDKKIERFGDGGVDSNSSCPKTLHHMGSGEISGVDSGVDRGGHPKTSFRSPTGHDPKNPLQGFGRFGASE